MISGRWPSTEAGFRGSTFPRGIELYEVKDGSIFCSCKSGDFVLGLRMFARLRPLRLIVEASGLADPRGMRKILDDNLLASEYTVSLTICMVDAVGSYKLRSVLPAVEEQIRAADVLIVNKIDLAGSGELAATAAMLDELNPDAGRFLTSYARIDPSLLDSRSSTAKAAGAVEECTLPGEGPPGAAPRESENLPGQAPLFSRGASLKAAAAEGLVRLCRGEEAQLVVPER